MAQPGACVYENYQDDLASPFADALVNTKSVSRGAGAALLNGVDGSGRFTFGSPQPSLDVTTYPPIYPEPSLRDSSRLKLFGLPQVLSSSFDETPPSSFSYSSNPLPSSSGGFFPLFQHPPGPASIAVPIKGSNSLDLAANNSQLLSTQLSAQISRQLSVNPSRQLSVAFSRHLCPEGLDDEQPKADYVKQQDEDEPRESGKIKQNFKSRTGPAPVAVAAAAARALQSTDVIGGFAKVPHRPMLGQVECSCPMVCMMELHKGSWRVVPLPTHSLQYKSYCHISQAFVDLQLLCSYPEVSVLHCCDTADVFYCLMAVFTNKASSAQLSSK